MVPCLSECLILCRLHLSIFYPHIHSEERDEGEGEGSLTHVCLRSKTTACQSVGPYFVFTIAEEQYKNMYVFTFSAHLIHRLEQSRHVLSAVTCSKFE